MKKDKWLYDNLEVVIETIQNSIDILNENELEIKEIELC